MAERERGGEGEKAKIDASDNVWATREKSSAKISKDTLVGLARGFMTICHETDC